MKVLVDTHAFIWWIIGDDRLSRAANLILGDPASTLFLSAASLLEIALKVRVGRLRFDVPDLETFLQGQLATNSFLPLPVTAAHALRVHRLPLLHGDPFDALLVAQSQVEGMTILTRDRQLAAYDVPVIW